MKRAGWLGTDGFQGVAICACGLLAAQTAPGQKSADLRADLARLNVRHTTEHYALAGTASDARLAHYGRCLEFIYAEYARGFAELMGSAAPAAEEAKLPGQGEWFPVILFAEREEYLQFSEKYFSGDLEFTRGAFVPSLQLLVVQDDSDFDQTYEALFHEAFHQFARRYVPLIPIWINEGLATYYGCARPTSSGLKFDRPAVGYFRMVKEAKTARSLIPLDELMVMNRAEFYKPDPVGNLPLTRQKLCYAQAYTLATYILNDPAGVELLRKYLKELAGAKNQSEVKDITRRHFHPQLLERMSSDWLNFVETK